MNIAGSQIFFCEWSANTRSSRQRVLDKVFSIVMMNALCFAVCVSETLTSTSMSGTVVCAVDVEVDPPKHEDNTGYSTACFVLRYGRHLGSTQ